MIVKFKYSKDHGLSKKGDVVDMHITTANALKAHKIGMAITTAKAPKKAKKGKAGAIHASKNG